ncbi:GTPase HflX [Pseudoxanthomonas sp. SGNA-20]|uniref:ribosome rescue GTPase HflX n=1 Tax=Pseudoxanthomonas sp. SGNA-20 TaxID=2493088 RepID=UPI000F63FC68|nr:ribosome rescue GTPase HflX [Pseudoxanthomonas sp. SGNA-20]RRN58674.1 GTPase HflX [Pseudoxanthomonas sp. SGNA-20]
MFERSRKGEHALLIQPHAGGAAPEDVLEEFADLARSAGASIAATLTARIDRPNPATLIGSGKLEEVKAAAEATGADLILVNHQLTPVQERNLERALQRRVVDRTGLILDIFAQRARSHEGKLQVELAQLKHMATRLVRGWTHLERQRGGSIGLRGPGETQLETDRRLLQKRLEQLQKRLDKVEVQHAQMRRARVRSELPRVALVGYTNAGKSTLFNTLTGAGAYAADQLFATLDPTVRRISLPGGSVVLADTVGFVRDLPHELVAAFRSTLSEAREADLLLHVVDAADPHREERIAQVDAVLAEVGTGELPQLLVFNKIDRIEGAQPRHDHASSAADEPGHRERVWISARDGLGLDLLQDALARRLDLQRAAGELRLPPSAGRLRSHLHALGAVRGEHADEHGWLLQVDLPRGEAERLAARADGAPLRALLPEPAREEWETDGR